MMQISETEAFRACRILFGADLHLNRDFLNYLQPSGAHSAFRKRAKATHPDSFPRKSICEKTQVRKFQDLNQAYQLIKSYLHQRELLSARRKPVATGGSVHPGKTTGAGGPFHAHRGQGQLPTRPLQFGTYLYYRGLISFSTLISALTWQRQQRPNFGQIARRWGWLTEEEVSQVLFHRQTGRFGERAERLGLLSPIQVRAILLHQSARQSKIGGYFIAQGLLSPFEIEQLLNDLSEHNLKYRHGSSQHFYYRRQN